MNPNRGEAPANFELPPQPPSPEGETKQEQSVEAPAARPETSGNRPQAPALPSVPQDIPAADQPLIAAPPQDVTVPSPDGSPKAGDNPDQIEREWIDKVKGVVASTREDPYLQKDQMSKVKAEYIKKRFNKQIKTDEAAA
jgi:hypothetical protein